MSTITHETGLPYLSPSILSAYSHTIDPGPMTAEQMLEAWRQILVDGHSVNVRHVWDGPDTHIYCLITTLDTSAYLAGVYDGSDPDPLKAFELAFRAYREAQETR